ncbi:hypothetical protein D3C87_571880 [compost metagenome]
MTKIKTKNLCSALLSLMIAASPVVGHAQTAAPTAENEKVVVSKADLEVGKKYYISANNLNLRSSNSTTAKNVVGRLTINDVVELYDVLNEATPLVQVKIIKSASVKADVAPELFVSKDFLSESEALTAASKYFVIQNIATEKTRVYERCTTSANCAHKLVMETDTVVGRNEEGTENDRYAYMTWLGHSKISEWVKFYQDGRGVYPRWYSKNQDMKTIPAPISESSTQLFGSRKWLVTGRNGEETVYGAFGWYAAKLTPAGEAQGVNYQWMHGTIGWGKDGSSAIDVTRGILLNMFSNPGSHGCTRLENRAVAYLRHLLVPGTDIYRVYARESTREKESVSGVFRKTVTPLPRYANSYGKPYRWNFILLANGAGESNGLSADAENILSKAINIDYTNLIEKGSYDVVQYPTAMRPDYTYLPSTGKSGDRYAIDSGLARDASSTNFRGHFLVDEGRFVNYKHPDAVATKGKIKVSGFQDFRTTVPEFLSTTGSHNPPPIKYKQENDNSGGA